MITEILMIATIMSLVHNSGFVENVDDYFNKKYPLRHLPYPVRCCLCGTFWLSLLFVILTAKLSLLSVLYCLIGATLTNVIRPALKVAENGLIRIIEKIDDKINE